MPFLLVCFKKYCLNTLNIFSSTIVKFSIKTYMYVLFILPDQLFRCFLDIGFYYNYFFGRPFALLFFHYNSSIFKDLPEKLGFRIYAEV